MCLSIQCVLSAIVAGEIAIKSNVLYIAKLKPHPIHYISTIKIVVGEIVDVVGVVVDLLS